MAPTKRRFCQHCREYVSTRTFREHYDLYFNRAKNEWEKIESSDEESGSQTEADSNTRNTTAGHESDGDHDQDETRSQPGIYVKKITIIIIRVMTLNSYSKTALIER